MPFVFQARVLLLLGFRRASLCLLRAAIERRLQWLTPSLTGPGGTHDRLGYLRRRGILTGLEASLIKRAFVVGSKAVHGAKLPTLRATIKHFFSIQILAQLKVKQ